MSDYARLVDSLHLLAALPRGPRAAVECAGVIRTMRGDVVVRSRPAAASSTRGSDGKPRSSSSGYSWHTALDLDDGEARRGKRERVGRRLRLDGRASRRRHPYGLRAGLPRLAQASTSGIGYGWSPTGARATAPARGSATRCCWCRVRTSPTACPFPAILPLVSLRYGKVDAVQHVHPESLRRHQQRQRRVSSSARYQI